MAEGEIGAAQGIGGRAQKLQRAAGIGRDLHGEFPVVIVGEAVKRQAHFLQVVHALDPSGPPLRFLDGWQDQPGQDGDDRDDEQQLQERERTCLAT